MTTLNKAAAEVMQNYSVHACTDVTGFGLIGHALEMAKGSKLGVKIQHSSCTYYQELRELAEKGFVPGGTKNNFIHVQNDVTFPDEMDQIDRWILCDAVTSGGLLISVAADQAEQMLNQLKRDGVDASLIGEILLETAGHITIV